MATITIERGALDASAVTLRKLSSRRSPLTWLAIGVGAGLIAMIAEYWIASPHQSGYPALSNSQKVQMEDALYQFKGHYVRIIACERKDCQTLARDLIDVFQAAGWEQVPAAGKTINSRWISVSGPKRDPAVNAVVEQLNRVMPAPVIPPNRDDGGAAEIMIGEFALQGQGQRVAK